MIEGILMKKQNIDRPYEKFMAFGPAYLTDAELLAIIIRTGTKGEDALELAKRILSLGGNRDGLLGLHHLTLNQLLSVHGIGEVKAVRLKCIAELSSRIAETRALQRIQFERPQLVAEYYMEQMRHLEKEQCVCVFLDGAMGLIKDQVLSVGTVNASLFSGREIFMDALSAKAVNLMLLHNHPSGNTTPSEADILITEKLFKASEVMDIPLIDHIIIGDNCYYSFREHGYLS